MNIPDPTVVATSAFTWDEANGGASTGLTGYLAQVEVGAEIENYGYGGGGERYSAIAWTGDTVHVLQDDAIREAVDVLAAALGRACTLANLGGSE